VARRDRDQDEISAGGRAPPRPIRRPTWPLVLVAVILTALATHWWDRDPAGGGVPPGSLELTLVLGSSSTVTHVEYRPGLATIEGGISVTNATGTAVTLLDLRSRGPVADLRSIDHSLIIDNGAVAEWQVGLRLQCGGEDWPDGLYVRARARVAGEIQSRVFYLALWRGVWGRSVSRDCA
jgi:hypothetical protein